MGRKVIPGRLTGEAINDMNMMSDELYGILENMPNLETLTEDAKATVEDYLTSLESSGTLMANKGIAYPLLNRGTDSHDTIENALLDVKVYNAEVNAVYRISHISKDNTAWTGETTFFEIGKSLNDGSTWTVINARGNENLANGQTGIKTHFIELADHIESLVITLDWDSLLTGSNNLANFNYIIHPVNYIPRLDEKEEENIPPYMKNMGIAYPLLNRGASSYSRIENAFLEAKVSMAKPGLIYRVAHVSKNNTAWGSPITFFEIGMSSNNGESWEVINARGQNLEENNQTGIQTHIVEINGRDEIFTFKFNWDAFPDGPLNTGVYDYIIDPVNYFFRRSSSSTPVNDLGDKIVARKIDRQIQIKQKLDDTRNFIIEYNAVGINDFHEFRGFSIQSNTALDSDFTSTSVATSGTDWISPYGMLVVNNPVSGSAGSITVGGSHGTTGGTGFPTGEFIRLSKFNLDGVEITATPRRGANLEITAEHYVTASNAINRTTGAKRHTAIERRIYNINGGNHNVEIEVEALEDITLTRYAGFMMPMVSSYFDQFYLYDTGGEIGVFNSGGLPNDGLPDGIYHTDNKDYQAIDRAVLVNNDMLLVMLTDRYYGIGTGEFAPASTTENPQSPILYTGGQFGKISAHNLGGSSNSYLLKTGEKLAYRGGYYFVQNQSTIENMFKYEINSVLNIDDLR